MSKKSATPTPKRLTRAHDFRANSMGGRREDLEIGLVLGGLALGALWAFLRVRDIFPVILGDEFLYSMNARKIGLWNDSEFGDFSNYLFNFVYSSTNLCGVNFYTCVKGLNAVFFFGVLTGIFFLLRKLTNTWVAGLFSLAVSVSPVSVYVSMFLPEMMFFFGIIVILGLTLRAAGSHRAVDWFFAGASIGVVSLVKPHAWLSLIAIFLFFLATATSNWRGLKKFFWRLLAFFAGAVTGRILVGLLVAGPKAVDFFGQYFSLELLVDLFGMASNGIISQVTEADQSSNSAIEGVLAIFPAQLFIHVGTVLALCAPAIAILLARLLSMVQSRQARESSLEANFSTLTAIWLGVMVVEIVAFTGWITGSGDDHTTRVLLRYYEFLLILVPMAALGAVWARRDWMSVVWARWVGGTAVTYGMSVATLGLFSTLTIQIADAPSLAGFVVSRDVYNLIPTIFFIAIVVFLVFPRFAKYPVLAVMSAAFVLTGLQAHDQYQNFRGNAQPADMLGLRLAELSSVAAANETLIIGDSRFNATAAAFAADDPDIVYVVATPGFISDEMIPDSVQLVGSLFGLNVADMSLLEEADGYWIYRRD